MNKVIKLSENKSDYPLSYLIGSDVIKLVREGKWPFWTYSLKVRDLTTFKGVEITSDKDGVRFRTKCERPHQISDKDPSTKKTRRKTGWTLGDCREAGHTFSGNDDTLMCWDTSHDDGPLYYSE